MGFRLATRLTDMADTMQSEDHSAHGHADGQGASAEEVSLRLAADIVAAAAYLCGEFEPCCDNAEIADLRAAVEAAEAAQ